MAGILTNEQKQLAFRLRARGWRLVDIAREVGCSAPMVGLKDRAGRFTTGVEDHWEPRQGCLGIADREDILVGLRADTSITDIARSLGRATSTISREVNANGGRTATRPGALTGGRGPGTPPQDLQASTGSAPRRGRSPAAGAVVAR
jgi:IS30 family transposase